ncbi:MAG: hypothetical protein WA446_03440 [Steroidobacteraceae bacterium]
MPAQCAVPRLLLITGAPASGKTRLARDLGTRYGCGIGSKDEIKETLFEVLGTGDAAWSRRLSDASFALLFNFAPQLLAEPATRAARLAARAADPGRYRGHHDRRIDVNAGDGATFLNLPGPRLRFNSEADWQSELAAFCAEFDRWYSPSKV